MKAKVNIFARVINGNVLEVHVCIPKWMDATLRAHTQEQTFNDVVRVMEIQSFGEPIVYDQLEFNYPIMFQ